ncbi:HNH endonuclease signature motif containing protein [Robertkochia solimangrovi]|uniref:HNH endonuclease signature motif containing protein n=1 Tax=Robertkochia solimangrovi TaxID=2213046 RepID=UPI00117C1486|nr:HNH endonuclease [Robertkochia solimangrovi]TRZ41667.1 hypothetical protein DMZ48_16805 [Robertkochia solimangrovi]
MKTKTIITAFSLIFAFNFIIAQDTYKVGNTEYYKNKYYSTTGKPMVKRSEANKQQFLRSRGLSETPEGHEIDHIIPLSEGGTDDPRNMQLLTVEQHNRKTARERAKRSSYTYPTKTRTYTSNSSYYNSNYNSNSTYSGTDNNGRKIYTGSRGGKYYINSNGNKTYIKSTQTSSRNNSYYRSSKSYTPSRTSSSRTIHTGPRGGKYYINSNGNKTYVKKN